MRGKRLSDEQIERVKAVYAETGNISAAARAADLSESTARRYVHERDEFAKARAQKRVEAIAAVAQERADIAVLLEDAREKYLRHLMTDAIISETTAKDAAMIVGILTDKHQLVTGGATQRTEANVHAALDTTSSDPEAAALARAYAARISYSVLQAPQDDSEDAQSA